jgi:transcriptional regulator with XRE-family HTH domain
MGRGGDADHDRRPRYPIGIKVSVYRLDGHADLSREPCDRDIVLIEVLPQLHPDRLTSMVMPCLVPNFPNAALAAESLPRPLSAMHNRIRELREKRGLSLQQVAEGAGTTFQQIHKLELGKRRLTDEWMRRLAPVLGVHPAALLLEFSEGQHSLNESVDEVLLLEAWRMSDAAKRWQVIDVLFPGQRRSAGRGVPNNHKKLKA